MSVDPEQEGILAQGTDETATAAPPPAVASGGTGLSAELTSTGKRFGAWLLELLLVMVTLGVGWLIWSLFAWSKGQTPAKSLLGMRCIRQDTGRAATWGTMFVREFVGKWILSTVTFEITTVVSGFMILGSSRQGIWDKIAGTVVVDDPNGVLID